VTHSKSTNEPSRQNEALSPLNPSSSRSDNHNRPSIDYVDIDAPTEIAYTTVPELFVKQVAKTPHAEALVFETRSLTYAELDSRVEFIFNLLVSQQVRAGKIVAVLLDRSEELVATLLAVQRAGAAYLPVDTEYPAERINYMLGNSKPACVVSTSKYEYIYCSIKEASTIILLDAEEMTDPVNSSKTSQPPHSSETWLPHPLDAAYVIYTSGSTGRPKGVVVSQLAIANHLLWMQRNYSLVKSDRVLQKTPAGFDVSVWEFFWPLIVGATLVVAPPQAHKAPNELVEIIQRERVTTIHFVPSMLEIFLDEAGITNCTSLRHVFASGEALPVETLRRFSETSSATLYNLYGPTEAAVDATAWECSVSDLARPRVPIGFPVAHTGVHVLDDHLQPVASGVEGELYITGVQIARCYLDNPELTAERFVACPFVASGERMYRTGDLVKYNQDGALDFIGRADTQLKINGVRVEAGEVESVLREYPAINQAVVVANHNAAGVPGLAAFLTVNESDAPVLSRLIRILQLPISDRPRVVQLTPDLPFCVMNQAEAQFMFKEIFQDQIYLPADVGLPDDAVVFDVGADIGLFSLYVGLCAPNAKIFAFEPAPEIFSVLSQNMALYDLNVNLQSCSLAPVSSSAAPYTYYKNISSAHGQCTDAASDEAVMRPFAKDVDVDVDVDVAIGQKAASGDEISGSRDKRLEPIRIEIPLRTISEVISTEDIPKISLMKINMQRCAANVLAGIDDLHWPIIDRLILEVHDIDDRLNVVQSLLVNRGFHVQTKQTSARAKSTFTVHAARHKIDSAIHRNPSGSHTHEPTNMVRTPENLIAAVRGHAAQLLPTSMVPVSMTIVPEIPLTVNGKIDRVKLSTDYLISSPSISSREPRSECERTLCDLVRKTLGLVDIGPEEDFFTLGGASLSAIILVSAITRAFNIPFKLRTLLKHPRISDLALCIEQEIRNEEIQ
jgi:amino acid adenylation domain-containing protein/FkbM family methyltransferase